VSACGGNGPKDLLKVWRMKKHGGLRSLLQASHAEKNRPAMVEKAG
jgi:hypothetical protein